MTKRRRIELERLLRTARQRVYDDPRYGRLISRTKRRLSHGRAYESPARARWAQSMYL